jgi:hypothetical protein
MDGWIILYWMGLLLMAWLTYRFVKSSPGLFTTKNFAKTSYTMGLLALGLIAFVSVCVMLLRAG